MKRILIIISMVGLLIQGINAQVITVQGVLRDVSNRAVTDGTYSILFEIYNAEDGGTLLWNNDGNAIDLEVINGVYNTNLSIGENIQSGIEELWLQVTVGAETMNDRVRLHLSPYEHYVVTGGSNAFPESGPVGIGTNDPDEETMLDVRGRIKDNSGFGFSPVGTITMFAGSVAPEGYLLCDGSELPSGSEYDMLDAVLSGAYGQSSRSNVPDLRGRMPVGLDNMGGNSANRVTNSSADYIGGNSGAEYHTLDNSETPNNTYSYAPPTASIDHNAPAQYCTSGSCVSGNFVLNFSPGALYGPYSENNGSPHNNMQPYIALNYIIKY
jgi:microcystin-dependent protein